MVFFDLVEEHKQKARKKKTKDKKTKDKKNAPLLFTSCGALKNMFN